MKQPNEEDSRLIRIADLKAWAAYLCKMRESFRNARPALVGEQAKPSAQETIRDAIDNAQCISEFLLDDIEAHIQRERNSLGYLEKNAEILAIEADLMEVYKKIWQRRHIEKGTL